MFVCYGKFIRCVFYGKWKVNRKIVSVIMVVFVIVVFLEVGELGIYDYDLLFRELKVSLGYMRVWGKGNKRKKIGERKERR